MTKKSTLIYRDEQIVGQCDCCGRGDLFPDCQGNGRTRTYEYQDPCGASVYDYGPCEKIRKVSQQEIVQIIASLSEEERNAIINKLTWVEEDIQKSLNNYKDAIIEAKKDIKEYTKEISRLQKKCKHRLTEKFHSVDPEKENYDLCKICGARI